LGDQVGVEFVAFFAAEEGAGGFVVADFARERGGFTEADVGRVAGDEIERKWRVASGEWQAKSVEQVRFEETDTVGYGVALRIALRYG
jgi:hypothetical protein